MSQDPENAALLRHRASERRLRDIAKQVERRIPTGTYFAVVTFNNHDHGGGGYAGYISNAERASIIAALRECADTLEAKMDVPPGAPIGRA